MTILVALEVLSRRGLCASASRSHLLPTAMAVGLLGVVISSLLLEHLAVAPSVAHVGLHTALLLAGGLWALHVMFTRDRPGTAGIGAAAAIVLEPERHGTVEAANANPTLLRCPRKAPTRLGHALAGYVTSALAVVVAGVWLPFVATGLAAAHGGEQTFVGTLLMAAITSAPELAVTLSAARLGALDMAIGNVMGANVLNVPMLGLGDLVYTGGPLLRVASLSHLATAISALLMTLLFIIGLQGRARRHAFGGVSVNGVMLVVIFLANSSFQYFGGAR